MKRLLVIALVLVGCGSGEDDTESSSNSHYETNTTSITAECYYIVDSPGAIINLGQVGDPEADAAAAEEAELARAIEIMSCVGNVDAVEDNDVTTTTTETNTNVDSNNAEVAE